jgi:Flp pilus assembly protein TadD
MRNEPDRAIADCTEAIRLDPKNALAYLGRGNCYNKKGERARAEDDFAQARRLGYKVE